MKNERIELSWGSGETELLLLPTNKGFQLLDYEFDGKRIHDLCGGKQYYISKSGFSGAGYIDSWKNLIRVGYYRVDTVRNDFQYPKWVSGEVNIMVPYRKHEKDKREILQNNPVIIKRNYDNTLIYCGFNQLPLILKTILSGEELEKSPRILRKNFVTTLEGWHQREQVEIKFYNLFGWVRYEPWEFVPDLIGPYEVNKYFYKAKIYDVNRLGLCSDRTLVRTTRIGGRMYATEVVDNDPCEDLKKPLRGWTLEKGYPQIMYKTYEDKIYIIGWVSTKKACMKKIERMTRSMDAEQAEIFLEFAMEELDNDDVYIEFDASLNKMLFLLDKKKQCAMVRRKLAEKVARRVEEIKEQYEE